MVDDSHWYQNLKVFYEEGYVRSHSLYQHVTAPLDPEIGGRHLFHSSSVYGSVLKHRHHPRIIFEATDTAPEEAVDLSDPTWTEEKLQLLLQEKGVLRAESEPDRYAHNLPQQRVLSDEL